MKKHKVVPTSNDISYVGACILVSGQYYDVNRDNFPSYHACVIMEDKVYGVRKTVFLFGSLNKALQFAKQTVDDLFVDFDLVDYSKSVEAKLRDRFTAFQTLDPNYFSYDTWMEHILAGRIYESKIRKVWYDDKLSSNDLMSELNNTMESMCATNEDQCWSTAEKAQIIEGRYDSIEQPEKSPVVCVNCDQEHNDYYADWGTLCTYCICKLIM